MLKCSVDNQDGVLVCSSCIPREKGQNLSLRIVRLDMMCSAAETKESVSSRHRRYDTFSRIVHKIMLYAVCIERLITFRHKHELINI